MAGVKVKIGADTDQLDDAVKRSKSQLNQLSSEFKAGAIQAAKLGAAAAAAGAALAAGLTVKGLAAVDAQAKLARQLGASIDGLRATQIAASDAGISMGVMQSAAEKLNQRIGEAQRGTGAAAESFKRLGLDARALGQMDVDQRMATIADRMQGLGLSTSQAADELRQMGIRNGEMVNLMLQGGDAIRNARGEVDALGLSLSEVDAAQVEAANDSFARIGMVVEGISQRMAVEFAPILDAVSKMMVEAGTDGVDMGEAISDGFNMGIKAAAFVIDAVEGVRRTFEVAGKGVALFGLGVADVMLTAADAIVNNPVRAINELIDAMNKIPGIDIDNVSLSGFGQTIESELETVRLASEIAIQDIQDTLMAPMPGMKFEQFVAESKANAEKAAEEMVAVSSLLRPDVGGGRTGAEDEQAESDAEKLREQLAKRLEVIREANLTEREATLEKYAIENEDLAAALEQKMLTEQEWAEQSRLLKAREEEELTSIEEKAAKARADIAEQEAKNKQAIMGDALSALTTLMNGESRKMFEIGKVAAIAQSIMSTYTGATKALELGWPMGPIAAAAITTAGFANVAKIKSQSFGGGSSGGSAGAGASNTAQLNQAAQPVQQREQTVANISLQGDTFSRESVKGLMEQMNELADDGMRFRVT